MVRNKAQSILEYVIVLTAIVAAIAFASRPGGPVQRAVNSMFNNASDVITDSTQKFHF